VPLVERRPRPRGPAGRRRLRPWEARLNTARSLAVYYFWYFVAVGILEPYLTPLWRDGGLSAADIGLLNAVMPAVATVAPFLWTAYADATRRADRIFLWTTWLSAVSALALPNARRFAPAAAGVFCLALFRTPLIPLANSMAFRVLKQRPERYAAIRLWGTVGYILAAVGAGAAMDRLGLRLGMYGVAIAMAVCGLVAMAGRHRERIRLAPAGVGEILASLRDRRLVVLVTSTALAWVSYGPYGTFYTIHLESLGFSRAFAGLAWALAAASELAVMLLWPRMCAWATPRTWLVVALCAHSIRWALSSAASAPGVLLAVQLTHAFTFGVFYLAAVQLVQGLAPEGLRATAQGVFASATFGIGGVVGSGLGGALYDPLGMRALYLASAAVAVGGMAIYVVGSRGDDRGVRAAAPTATREDRP
jgi:PPP family 3-phenylpropionic acid transporter